MYRTWPVFVALALALGVIAWAAGGGRVVGDALERAHLSRAHEGTPRTDETDDIADIVARAISWPRQSSADGYARAALATRAARDGRLSVVAATPLRSGDALEPLARLVFRIHLDVEYAGFVTNPAVTYCYRAEFNRYGVIGTPERIDCPPGAAPLTPPPAPAERRVPPGADKVVARALAAPGVQAQVTAGVRRLTAPTDLPPTVSVNAEGTAVAVSAPGTCLLGRRLGSTVQVWFVPPAMAQPGELSCDPATALGGLGQRPPH